MTLPPHPPSSNSGTNNRTLQWLTDDGGNGAVPLGPALPPAARSALNGGTAPSVTAPAVPLDEQDSSDRPGTPLPGPGDPIRVKNDPLPLNSELTWR